MPELVRLSISLEKPLYDRLEKLVREHGYSNRSEFIRDMVRDRLVEREWEHNREVVGTVTLVYDHHARRLSEKLTSLQHHHHDSILATTHVHLDEHMCAEMILIKGRAAIVKEIADMLRRQKGILHATLSMSTSGKNI
jgi:CopG family nickel-responsive transcriptional regulator